MPKYWGKQIFAHGSFPEAKDEEKKKRRKREEEKKKSERW